MIPPVSNGRWYFYTIFKNLRRRNWEEVSRMKVKCIKRYSDVRLNKIIEAGTVLEVDKARADHLVHEGVAEIAKETEKAADKGKE